MRKYLESLLGVILITISVDLFMVPMNIVSGGTAGLAVIVNNLLGISPSLFIFIFYFLMIILYILVFKFDNLKDIILFAVIYTLSTKLFENLPEYIYINYEESKLTLYLFAALLNGAGNGLVYKNGFITGGTDVLKLILSKKKKIQMGVSTFIIDGIIIITGGYLFGLVSVIYALIIKYIGSVVTDKLTIGISNDKTFYIITKEEEKVRNCIKNTFKVGITEIDGYGFTNDKKHILMTVIKTRNYLELKEKISNIDNEAFFIIVDTYHTYHGGV